MHANIYIIISFFISGLQLLLAQDLTIRYHRFGIEDGLSQNTVSSILQDRQGYMWFATRGGLNKYDGYEFQEFKTALNGDQSLPSNNIQVLFQDIKGFLWIGTADAGLSRFDPETETLQNYFHDPKDGTTISDNQIFAITEDSAGKLWIGTSNGLNCFYPEQDSFYVYHADPTSTESLSDNFINDILFDQDGMLWIGTENNGACVFDLQKQTFKQFLHDDTNDQTIGSDRIQEIYQDSQGRLWFTTKVGLSKYLPKTGLFKNIKIKGEIETPEMITMEEDQLGNIWIGSARIGLIMIDGKTEVLTHHDFNTEEAYGLPDSGILDLYRDRENNMWAGLTGLGLYRFNPNPVFQLYAAEEHSNHISNPSIRALYVDQDRNLWVGSYGGLDFFNTKTGEHQRFHYENEKWDLPSNNIYSLLPDGEKNLWIGMEGQGLVYFHRDQQQFIPYRHDALNNKSIPSDFVYCMARDEEDFLWIGTANGLARIEPQGKNTIVSTNYLTDRASAIGSVRSLESTKDNFLWIGTEFDGLYYFNIKTGDYTRFRYDPRDADGIKSNNILSLFEESDTLLWIGTHGGGLNRYNRKTNTFTNYTKGDGLANNIVYGILPDNEGNLWLSTNYGISYINTKDEKIKNFDVNDGLQSNEFNRGAYHRSWTGELFFGGIQGLNAFYPEEVLSEKRTPTAIITDFQIFNESVPIDTKTGLEKHISYLNEINLQHTDRVISFEFSGLYYSGPEKVSYAYKLDGVNNDWVIAPSSKRYVTYTNLSSGEYIFHVQAFVDQDQRNTKVTTLILKMSPAPWKTPLAYLLYLGLGLILLYLVRAYELKRIVLKNQLREERFESQKLQDVDRIKSEFFTNISHEFRTPLTLIKGRIRDIQKVLSTPQQKNLQKHFDISNRNIDRLEDLMNQLLDLSKLESGTIKLKTKPIELIEFLQRIESTFQVLIQQKGLTFKLTLPKEPITIYFDEIKMERVINNLVANAIEFTPKGGTIQCVLHDNCEDDIEGIGSFINIEVVDTGEGISEKALEQIFDRFYQADTTTTRSHEGTGIGLALVKELTELHGGSVSVKSKIGSGTTFSIMLPKGTDHLLESEIQQTDTKTAQIDKKTIFAQKQFIAPTQGISKSLLIVEDNHDMADYIRDQLKSEYKTTIAYNGEEGLERAIDILPDLIISDVMMPKMDGFTLAKEIRKNEVLSHVPIILLTAKTGKDDRITGHQSLADAYITKPFNADELIAQVASLLESRRRLYRKFSETWMFQQEASALDGPDQEFMSRIKVSIESNMSNSTYSVDELARATFLSRRQLERRLRDLSGITPGEIIRKTRLLRAKQLLENNKLLTVSEVTNQIGFNNVKYFSRLFQREFGITPSTTLKS